jgi:hypothetical protein
MNRFHNQSSLSLFALQIYAHFWVDQFFLVLNVCGYNKIYELGMQFVNMTLISALILK